MVKRAFFLCLVMPQFCERKSEKMTKKTYQFVVNTEAVNSYGYRILTDGIDTEQYMRNPVVLYMHNRAFVRGDEVIGRVVSLNKENGKLIAEVEFDEADEFAKQIAGKVERGFIKMCSMGADIVETSSDTDLIIPGQTLETVTKCKMVELSIVDIGGNDDALRLSKNGRPIQLRKIEFKQKNMSELKTIALALGMSADTGEAVVLQKVNELKLAKDKAETETKEWKEKFIALQKTEATKLLDKAVKLGLIPEDLKDAQLLAFENDFDGQTAKLSKLIEDKETENAKNERKDKVKDFVGLTKQSSETTPQSGDTECFDYLQRHNVVELRRLKTEEPEKYARLFKEYQNKH